MRDLRDALGRKLFKLRPRRAVRVECHKDLPARMSDGVTLLADHYVPDGDTAAPLVLMRSPYGRRFAVGLLARSLAYEGFQVVVQSCRGTAGSGGTFDRPFAAEAADGRDTVAWLQEQPFYPGRFATFGGSYLGYVQLALPPEAKAELFGAVLQVTPTSTHDIVWPHGALALATSLGWSTSAHRGPAEWRNLFRARSDRRNLRSAGRSAPLLQTYTIATESRVGFLEEWWTHPDASDPYWREHDHRGSLATYTCPVLVQGGWYDLFLEQSIDQYERLVANGTEARLTVGPWSHGSFSAKGLRIVLAEAADFLRAAYGLTPPMAAPPVRLIDARSGTEHLLAAWPPASSPEHHHLGAGGLTSKAPSGGRAATSFTYDPHDPTPQAGGSLLEPGDGPVDNAALERRHDVVTFDSPRFAADEQYIGRPRVDLWVTADVPAPQLFVRLNVVDAAGLSTNIADSLVCALDADTGSPVPVTAELSATCVQIRAGERLRLVVAGGAYPQFARSPGTVDSPVAATTFRAARIDIRHDADHPSRLTLPRTTAAGNMEASR